MAADPRQEALTAARAALKQAVQVRDAALGLYRAGEVEVERLRELVRRLEAAR